MFYSKYGLIFFKYGLPSFIIVIALGFKLFRYIYNKASKNDRLRDLIKRVPLKPLYRRRLIIVLAHLSILLFALVSSFSSGTTRADLNITPLVEASVDKDFTDLSSLKTRWPVGMYNESEYAKFRQILTINGANNYGLITFTLFKDRTTARMIYDSRLKDARSENYVQEYGGNGDNSYFLTRIYGGRNIVHGTFPLLNPILDDDPGSSCNLVVQKNNLVIEVNCPYHSPQTDKCVLLDTPLFRIMNITKVANPSADVLIQEVADKLFEIPTE